MGRLTSQSPQVFFFSRRVFLSPADFFFLPQIFSFSRRLRRLTQISISSSLKDLRNLQEKDRNLRVKRKTYGRKICGDLRNLREKEKICGRKKKICGRKIEICGKPNMPSAHRKSIPRRRLIYFTRPQHHTWKRQLVRRIGVMLRFEAKGRISFYPVKLIITYATMAITASETTMSQTL